MCATIRSVGKPPDSPPLRDQCLLAFQRQGPFVSGKHVRDVVQVSFDDASRNIILFGGTGRGKTTRVLLPAAHRLIQNNCPGLIVDVKGEYLHLEEVYPEQVVRIGPDGNLQFNLISGINKETLRALLENLRQKFVTSESYWGSTGVEDAVLVYLLYRAKGYQPTLAQIYAALANPRTFCTELERYLLCRESVPKSLLDQLQYREADEFSILRVGNFRGADSGSHRTNEQYAWQTNGILKALAPFSNNAAIRRAFCAETTINLKELVYETRKVILLDLNSDAFPDVAYTTARILRSLYMRAITTSSSEFRNEQGFGREVFSFMLIDEFHGFVNVDLPASGDSLRDDNLWFDRSRGYGHINIVATQSISSLLARAAPEAARTIIQNCQTTIVLPSTDPHTLARVTELSGYDTPANPITYRLLNPESIGDAFIHIANHCRSNGRATFATIRTGALTAPEYAFMSEYLRVSHSVANRGNHTTCRAEKVDNPFRKAFAPETSIEKLILLTTQPNEKDWLLIEALRNETALSAIHYLPLNHDAIRMAETKALLNGLATGDVLLCLSLATTGRHRQTVQRAIEQIFSEARDQSVILITCLPSHGISDLERYSDYVLEYRESAVMLIQRLIRAANAIDSADDGVPNSLS
ncbi:MAG: type IV secretory system conjugative DNA transfer family protein [Thiogranum sp.]|nr:type IV secretory system conjugative DNA transfer family protein [Thiogranum sp.]